MRTWLLPPGVTAPAARFRELGSLQLEEPEVTPALAGEIARRLRGARPALIALKTDAILRAIEDTIREWLLSGSADRTAAENAFRASTGMPAPTSPFLPLLDAYRGMRVGEWARAEVDPFGALDGFAPGRGGAPVRALGPGLAVHVLPGNVPLVWLSSLLGCLIMRTPCLVKPSADDPLTAALFVSSLARRLPALAEALAVLPWAGGDGAVETRVFEEAEAVVAYGSDDATRSLARRVPPAVRLLVHGPRFAVGAVGREMAGPGRFEPIAASAARDALLYDGRGCLSLVAIYAERGGLYEPREMASMLARAMATASEDLPPGRAGTETAALTQSWRARIRARALAGKPSALFTGARGLDWTVCYDDEIAPPLSLFRTVWVSGVNDLDEVPSRLASGENRMHALAFAGPKPRGIQLAGALAPLGLTRLAAFGSLQEPPLFWPHGGTSVFKQLLRWVRLET